MKIEEVERLDRHRDLSLLLQLVGFAAWWGTYTLLMDSGWHPAGILHISLSGLSVAGWVVWVGGLIWLVFLQRFIRRRPELCRALNDEGVVRNRMRAILVSFSLVLFYLVVLRVLTVFVKLPAGFVVDVLIWLSVVGHLGAYLWFSRR